MLVQTTAILVDAYRELNAKKMFWITMGLNLLVVVLFASLGINERGVTLWHWTFNSDFMNTSMFSAEVFYKLQFTSWGIPVWLSWAATILALISTASIVPEMVSGGMIEPLLSKPIGRARLFLTKYAGGLLFVTLQVLVFSAGAFLVIGIRGGAWEWRMFLAVPIVVAFFSYLFAMSAFLGMMTRSTIAALLLTILFWMVVFIVNTGDNMMLLQREGTTVRVEDLEEREANGLVIAERMIEQARERGEPIPGENAPLAEGFDDSAESINPFLKQTRRDLVKARENQVLWTKWSSRVTLLKAVLPKTDETINLLSRYLMSAEDVEKLVMEQSGVEVQADDERQDPAFTDPRAAARAEDALRERSLLWVIGTSLLFECFFVGLATLVFVRRDF